MGNNIEEMMAEHNKELLKELNDILKKIDEGEKTTFNYYQAFENYQLVGKKGEYKSEIEKYAQLTFDNALNDIATNHEPNNAYVYLYTVYQYRKDKNNAILSINKAIELDPNNADLYILRADFYKKYGDKKMADINYQKAIELNPEMEEHIKLLQRVDATLNDSKKTIFILYLIIILFVLGLVYCVIEPFLKF